VVLALLLDPRRYDAYRRQGSLVFIGITIITWEWFRDIVLLRVTCVPSMLPPTRRFHRME
jgi:hypothetical protein